MSVFLHRGELRVHGSLSFGVRSVYNLTVAGASSNAFVWQSDGHQKSAICSVIVHIMVSTKKLIF